MTGDLTAREIEVVALIAEGFTASEVGGKLDISVWTVRGHMRSIFKAWGVPNAPAAVSQGYQRGVLHRSVSVADMTLISTVAHQGLLTVARLLVAGDPRRARMLARRLLSRGVGRQSIARPRQQRGHRE